jgi:hypothetical protein
VSVGSERVSILANLDQEDFNGRPVLVRFIISDIKPESCKFEQSFSTDNGEGFNA